MKNRTIAVIASLVTLAGMVSRISAAQGFAFVSVPGGNLPIAVERVQVSIIEKLDEPGDYDDYTYEVLLSNVAHPRVIAKHLTDIAHLIDGTVGKSDTTVRSRLSRWKALDRERMHFMWLRAYSEQSGFRSHAARLSQVVGQLHL